MSIYKNGIWESVIGQNEYLVNNFGDTHTTTDWTVSGSMIDNVLTLTGQSPQLTSKTFTVKPDDIIQVEFSLAFTVLSDNSGVFIGSKGDANTYRYTYDTNTKKWGNKASNASSSWNTYWLSNYNSTTLKNVKSYIIGSNVNPDSVPAPEGSTQMIQLGENNTSTNIRTGYNVNTGMTFKVYYFKVTNLTHNGFSEVGTKTAIGKSWTYSSEFIEI